MSSPVDEQRELLRRAKALMARILDPGGVPTAELEQWLADMEAWEK